MKEYYWHTFSDANKVETSGWDLRFHPRRLIFVDCRAQVMREFYDGTLERRRRHGIKRMRCEFSGWKRHIWRLYYGALRNSR